MKGEMLMILALRFFALLSVFAVNVTGKENTKKRQVIVVDFLDLLSLKNQRKHDHSRFGSQLHAIGRRHRGAASLSRQH